MKRRRNTPEQIKLEFITVQEIAAVRTPLREADGCRTELPSSARSVLFSTIPTKISFNAICVAVG
jgi:hypothetical protein